MSNVNAACDYFENLFKSSYRIYPDACDYGFVISPNEKVKAREHLKVLRWSFDNKVTKWGVPEASHGSTTKIEGAGFNLIVDFNHDLRGLEFLTVTFEQP